MTTNNPNAGCTDVLFRVTSQILDAGVDAAAPLMEMPELRQALMQAIHQWCIECQAHDARRIGMDDQTLADVFTDHLFRPDAQGNYPTINRLLFLARRDGADAVGPFMASLLKYYFGLFFIRFQRRMKRMKVLHSLLPDACAPDPCRAWEDMPVDVEAVQATLARLGRDSDRFIEDVVILADASDYDRKKVCDLLSGGQQVSLVSGLAERLWYCLGCDAASALGSLGEQASAFTLPAEFSADAGALERFITGLPVGTAHARLTARDSAGIP